MQVKDQTGVDETGADEGSGSEGAADQGSKERTVPLSALEAERKARQKLETKLAQVEGLVEGLKSGQPKSEKVEKTFTRAELKAFVTAGQLTEDQMEAQLDKQADAKSDAKLAQHAAAARISAEVQAELSRHLKDHPELAEEGSELRAKAADAYQRLIKRGQPDNAVTELTAVEMAVASLSAPKGRKKQLEAHEETGGAGDDKGRGDSNSVWSKGLNSKQKAHYQKLIDRGIYNGTAGEKALKAELETARGGTRH